MSEIERGQGLMLAQGIEVQRLHKKALDQMENVRVQSHT